MDQLTPLSDEFTKMQSQFHVLQTNIAISSTNFIGIVNQVHYIDNQFNLNLQPISLHVVNNLTIWYPYSQLQ